MKVIRASSVKKFQSFSCLIYSEPGKGKTSMVKTLTGKTIVWSVDGMYSVLEGLQNVEIWEMEPEKPIKEMEEFYRQLRSQLDDVENIVIDNLSTYIKIG